MGLILFLILIHVLVNIFYNLPKENYRVSEIAEILNRHRATIYREIKRIKGGYSSEDAQLDADTKARNKGRSPKITPELKNLIEDRLCKTWS